MTDADGFVPLCRLCGAERCVSLGAPAYRVPPRVAGVEIKVDDLDLNMYKCLACEYYFVYPEIPQDRLAACYAASNSHWDTGDGVADLRSYGWKHELLRKYAPRGRRFLNVGCYDGGFESFLGDVYERFGVEPSSDAAAKASMHGVVMLGSSVDDLDAQTNKFDIIVLFDVAEHIIDPARVFNKLRTMLSEGGIIMIETGNMDSFPWQDRITLNPYCAIYEHVGFFNRKSVAELSKIIGLDLVYFEPSIHMRIPSASERFKRWLKLRAYWVIRFLHSVDLPLSRKFRNVARGPVPVPPVQCDHFVAIMRDGQK